MIDNVITFPERRRRVPGKLSEWLLEEFGSHVVIAEGTIIDDCCSRQRAAVVEKPDGEQSIKCQECGQRFEVGQRGWV